MVRRWPRYEKYQHHEVYVMGHLLSAACAHYRMTGKTSFLDVARRVGDYLYATFKPPRPAELEHKVFNPSQIMGLAELYRTTGEPMYLEAAGFFVDYHGATPGGVDIMQDRVPLREETQVVGHMVLATYLYAGATDVFLQTGDATLRAALDRLWHDLTEKRMYVHGGVAPIHRGHSVRPREVVARQPAPGAPVPAGTGARPADEYPAHLIHRHLDDVHAGGARVKLTQETEYPWDGAVRLTFQEAPGEPFALRLRIPSWAEGAGIRVNGDNAGVHVQPGSYARIERAWRAGDVVDLGLPMDVRLLEGNPRIESTRNQVTVARGPLIYCLESPDLPDGVRVADVYVSPDAVFTPRRRPGLLGGVTVLETEAQVIRAPDWNGTLYRPLQRTQPERRQITLIPYYAWANRGLSEMTVWLPLAARA
jgi:DUF1680 family protein